MPSVIQFPPCAAPNYNQYDFGSVQVGKTLLVTFSIIPLGGTGINVAAVSALSDPVNFVATGLPATPFIIGNGGLFPHPPIVLQVTFQPQSQGSFTCTISFTANFNSFTPNPTVLTFTGTGVLNPPPPQGTGITGAVTAVPKIIQSLDKLVLILGSGYPPQVCDGVNTHPITNTFAAAYSNWQPSTTFLVGDLIIPTVPNGFYYKCVQGGETGTAEPSFPLVAGQQVADVIGGGQVTWVCVGPTPPVNAPPGCLDAISHSGSLWLFNTAPSNQTDGINGPSSLEMYDVDSLTSFNPLNQAFIGKDDGSVGMALASFTIAELGIAPLGSLVAFKNFSTYQITGVFGAADFNIQQIQSDMGCIAPRSVKFIPGFGIIRMTHLGFGVFDGIRDKVVSEPIRPYIFGSAPSDPFMIAPVDMTEVFLMKGDQTAIPPMFVCAAPIIGSNDKLVRLFLFDLVLKSWMVMDTPADAIGSVNQLRLPGQVPMTVLGGDSCGSLQIMQNGAIQWGLSTTGPVIIPWAFTTPEVFNGGDPLGMLQVYAMIIRGVNVDGFPLTVAVNLQTESGYLPNYQQFSIGKGEFEIFIGINELAMSANAIISGIGRVEIESVTWRVQPKPTGIPNRIT